MTSTVRRAGAFALVGSLALVAPLLDAAASVPFAAVAVLAAFAVDADTRLFELFARPGDYEEGRLNGLVGFTLAAAGLGLFASFSTMPLWVFVGSVLLLAYGTLGARAAESVHPAPIAGVIGFALAGSLACAAGLLVAASLDGAPLPAASAVVFLATSGALIGALVRAALFERDDPLVLLSVGLLLWLLSTMEVVLDPTGIALAVGVTAVFGYASYALETASIPGMLTGMLLSLLTIVLGGYGWFVVLMAFFAIGGLSTKFRYEEKVDRGVAEDNEGARGSGNVLANAAVALGAVLAHAATPATLAVAGAELRVGSVVFLYAFAGSVATAMSDTLSSEIGGVYDRPRLITTLRPVEPGTDGAVTWQGEVAGVAGAGVVAALAALLIDPVGTTGAAVVVVAGVVGMTVDSLLGATLEGGRLGNQSVNFLATLSGALAGGGLAVLLDLAAGP